MTLNIRPAAINDARMIAELLTNIDDYKTWNELGADEMEKTVRQSLENAHSERLLFVAEIDGRNRLRGGVLAASPVQRTRRLCERIVYSLRCQWPRCGHGAAGGDQGRSDCARMPSLDASEFERPRIV